MGTRLATVGTTVGLSPMGLGGWGGLGPAGAPGWGGGREREITLKGCGSWSRIRIRIQLQTNMLPVALLRSMAPPDMNQTFYQDPSETMISGLFDDELCAGTVRRSCYLPLEDDSPEPFQQFSDCLLKSTTSLEETNNTAEEDKVTSSCQKELYRLALVDEATGSPVRAATPAEAEYLTQMLASRHIPSHMSEEDASSDLQDSGGGEAGFADAVVSLWIPTYSKAGTEAEQVDHEVHQNASAKGSIVNAGKLFHHRIGGPCDHCGAAESPQWRRGPSSKPCLCNACGTRFRRKAALVPIAKSGATRQPAIPLIQKKSAAKKRPAVAGLAATKTETETGSTERARRALTRGGR
eukprot:gene20285-27043_t